MSECDSILPDLPALITGELGEARGAHLEAHLAGCPRCRRELLEMRRLIGLVSRAPLEHRPPEHLEHDIFSFLELEPVTRAVRDAPLEHEPPPDLEHRALERAGVAGSGPSRWQRTSAYLAPALAACLLIVGFIALTGDDDSAGDGAPPGETLTELTFAPPSADPSWTPIEGAIVERDDGTFEVAVDFDDYPEVSGEQNCRLDLVDADGDGTTVARFQISKANTDWWSASWPLPGDPRDYESLEMFVEDRSTGAERSVLEAPIDA
ncbi:MAG: anti-sigma factor family protein [Actinomycetota bacterium]